MDNQLQQENHSSEKQRKVFPWIRIFFSSKWLFSILVGLMVAELVCTGIYVFAAPPTSKYNPGEILDPTCAPGVTNCTTVPPLYNSATGTGTGNMGVGAFTLISNTSGARNIAIGDTALRYNLTGVDNVAVGAHALNENDTGVYNVAVGGQALQGNRSATGNTAVGYGALSMNTTNTGNVAVGYNALTISTGNSNTAVGYLALSSNTTGIYNAALGRSALLSNTGSYNTAFGGQALQSNTTGTGNIAVGSSALLSNNIGDYNIAIGRTALFNNQTGGTNIAVGYQALYTNSSGYGNVAVGTGALYTNTVNQNTAIGNNALYRNSTGYDNVAVGYNALAANTTGHQNIAIGVSALATNTTQSDIIAIGTSALASDTTGNQNVAIGTTALTNNTTGSNNVAVGNLALSSNTTAHNNTAMGHYALRLSTGDGNSAFGSGALTRNSTGYANTAVGSSTLDFNSTGNGNTALGQIALASNDTGNNNTGLGVFALSLNDSGNNNTAVGTSALALTTTASNNVALGYMAGYYNETESDTFYVDDRDRTDTNGDQTKALLYGKFADSTVNQMLTINAQTIKMPYLQPGTGDPVELDTTTKQLYINTSSLRYKHDIQPFIKNWAAILQVQPKSFKYNNETNQESTGYIAEDFDALGLKDLVGYDKEGRPNSIKYDRISLYTVEILKQQQIAINELKQRLGLPTENTQINPAGTLGSGEVSGVTLSAFDQSIQSSLSKLGATLSGGIISLKQVITENLTAKTARVEKMEMVASNGDIYCTWIDNDGNWQKAKGDCASISAGSATETVVTSVTAEQVSQQINEQQQVAQEVQQATQAAEQATQQAQQAAQEAQQAAQEVQQAQVQEQIEQAQPQVLNIASVDVIPNINVDFGTALVSANLPTTVNATLSDNTTQTLTIVWDNGMPAYDPNTAGTYVFFGTLTLPENVTNTDNINATANIVVAPQPQEEPTVLESVSGLIQNAVASLLNGAWNLITGMINSVVKAVLSISVIQKATATLIMQTPEALQSWTLETKSLTTGIFEPITELLK